MSEGIHSALEAEHQEAMAKFRNLTVLGVVFMICGTILGVSFMDPDLSWMDSLQWGEAFRYTTGGFALLFGALTVLLLTGIVQHDEEESAEVFFIFACLSIVCIGLYQLVPEQDSLEIHEAVQWVQNHSENAKEQSE